LIIISVILEESKNRQNVFFCTTQKFARQLQGELEQEERDKLITIEAQDRELARKIYVKVRLSPLSSIAIQNREAFSAKLRIPINVIRRKQK